MIKFCDDVKTLKQFREFSIYLIRIRDMGLEETAKMMRWSYHCLIRPALFDELVEEDRRKG